jgi:two-component system nitrate/nitrite response regulator NarL
MNPKKITRVIVVDDHPLFRRGVVELLNESGFFEVLDDFDDGHKLLDALPKSNADLLMLDLHMPAISGLKLLKKIKSEGFTQKVIILTASEDSTELFDAISAGADGYLLKGSDPDEIIDSLQVAMHGNVVIPNEGITMLARHLSESHHTEQQETLEHGLELTEREQQTLQLITKGLSNKLIARELGISDGTVKVYVKSLLRKLNLSSRLELAAWAHSREALGPYGGEVHR